MVGGVGVGVRDDGGVGGECGGGLVCVVCGCFCGGGENEW